MEVIIYQVDAFTDKLFGGNPAGIVIDEKELTKDDMQNIAKEMNLSETAFINQIDKNIYETRFFTPICEVDLCGHATIAAFYTLGQKGYIRSNGKDKVEVIQKTNVGLLPVEIYFNNDKVEKVLMHQETPKSFGVVDKIKEISKILGISEDDMKTHYDTLPEVISTGLKDLIIPVKNKEILKNLNIDFIKMKEFCIREDVIGMHVFSIDESKTDVVYCRNFAPIVGIMEESATGTANGALIYYLKKNNLLKSNTITARQGEYMNRPSEITCQVYEEETKISIKVGGKAIIILEGVMKI